jgi:large subunit ribosomal protein L5
MNQVTSTKEIYTQKAVPGIREALGIQNPMAIPRIEKIVVNTGIGKILKDSKQVEEIVSSLQTIVGQKVVMTKARKAIAGFKIREGLEVGVSVTLHGKRMWDFSGSSV